MIRYICPTCQSSLESPVSQVGQKVACPKCHQRLQIPNPITKTILAPLAPPLAPARRSEPKPHAVYVSVRCHDCDCIIAEGESFRRKLETRGLGSGWIVFLLVLLGPIWLLTGLLIGSKSKKVSFCIWCNTERDKRKKRRDLTTNLVIAVLIYILSACLLVILFMFLTN